MEFYYRTERLIPNTHSVPPTSNESNSFHGYSKEASFDTNMIIILAALLCALICALGLNSIIRQSLLEQPETTSSDDAGDVEAGLRQPGTAPNGLDGVPHV
ncbi:RING-H2 finger protein ATL78-like isoform X2 [Nicotiana tabacum]|uniref:RING-H2 finger protein ATL78-like isoform X2 n=1 Tax=Nicotiana tabacum TaxID=4097 RepID=A0AC58SGQ2_TOBAC